MHIIYVKSFSESPAQDTYTKIQAVELNKFLQIIYQVHTRVAVPEALDCQP